jgi:hypothetical protein
MSEIIRRVHDVFHVVFVAALAVARRRSVSIFVINWDRQNRHEHRDPVST